MASSNIEYCTNDGKNPLNCKKKLVVTLSVDPKQQEGSEEVDFVRSASDITQETPTKVYFSPIKVAISRSHVSYRYPLTYVKAFNAKPYEEVIAGDFISRCNDDFDESATCGLLKHHGKPVPYSQGFCCSCDVCQVLGLCSSNSRSQRHCDLFGRYTAASCLRHSKDWYDGYNIGPYLVDYRIRLTLSQQIGSIIPHNSSFPTNLKTVLLLSPTESVASSEEFDVIAKMVGSLSPDAQPLDLTHHIFLSPLVGTGSDRVEAGSAEWMILDQSLVTLDGRTCDKVGVGYEAFATQSDACRRAFGSCLNSQIDDYRAMDMKAIASGGKGKYMVNSFGNFSLQRSTNTTSSDNTLYLRYTASVSTPVLIILTLSADHLRYIESVSPGVILDARVSQDEVTVNTKGTEIITKIKNTGIVTSRFTVSVKCTENVFPILEQVIFLAALEVRELHYDLNVESVDKNGTSFCEVILKGAQGHVEDKKKVVFKTKEIEKDRLTPDEDTGASRETTQSASVHGTCDKFGFLKGLCKLWVFIAVKIGNSAGEMIGILVLSIALIFFLFAACKCACKACSKHRGAAYRTD
ncbi:unnamed protein product [Phytomonas sp. EM1]|nr:unnamed protein product [Phytomonas sp. EM1]|eukprot:CCW64758.1 unnamed protein product [Phytomonas sp. isolate EM1]